MISFNGLDMKLTITSASTELSGTYKVVVSNEYGQDESSARLIVKVIMINQSIYLKFYHSYKLLLLTIFST
jgi:hypothetical protein